MVIVEDLVSTGISSLKTAEAISNFGGEVSGMVAIFTYNFPHAKENFKKAKVELTTLSRYQILIDLALEEGEISQEQVDSLMEWREDPANWGK